MVNRCQAQLHRSPSETDRAPHTRGLTEENPARSCRDFHYLSFYCSFTQNVWRTLKNSMTHEEKTTEADPAMTQMVELPDRNFKVTLTNMFKDLVERETTRVTTRSRQMKNIKKEPNGNTKNKNIYIMSAKKSLRCPA